MLLAASTSETSVNVPDYMRNIAQDACFNNFVISFVRISNMVSYFRKKMNYKCLEIFRHIYGLKEDEVNNL
jgi:hypothetical protein